MKNGKPAFLAKGKGTKAAPKGNGLTAAQKNYPPPCKKLF